MAKDTYIHPKHIRPDAIKILVEKHGFLQISDTMLESPKGRVVDIYECMHRLGMSRATLLIESGYYEYVTLQKLVAEVRRSA